MAPHAGAPNPAAFGVCQVTSPTVALRSGPTRDGFVGGQSVVLEIPLPCRKGTAGEAGRGRCEPGVGHGSAAGEARLALLDEGGDPFSGVGGLARLLLLF